MEIPCIYPRAEAVVTAAEGALEPHLPVTPVRKIVSEYVRGDQHQPLEFVRDLTPVLTAGDPLNYGFTNDLFGLPDNFIRLIHAQVLKSGALFLVNTISEEQLLGLHTRISTDLGELSAEQLYEKSQTLTLSLEIQNFMDELGE